MLTSYGIDSIYVYLFIVFTFIFIVLRLVEKFLLSHKKSKYNDYDSNPDWIKHSLNSHMVHHPDLDPDDPDSRKKRRLRIKYAMAKILVVTLCVVVPLTLYVLYQYPINPSPPPPPPAYRTTWFDLPAHLPTVDEINPRRYHKTKHKWYKTVVSHDIFTHSVLKRLEFWELQQLNEWLEDLNVDDDWKGLLQLIMRERKKYKRSPLKAKNTKETLIFMKKCIDMYKENKKNKQN